MAYNLNDAADRVTEAEGLKVSVNKGQVKEVIKRFLIDFANNTEDAVEVLRIVKKYYGKTQ